MSENDLLGMIPLFYFVWFGVGEWWLVVGGSGGVWCFGGLWLVSGVLGVWWSLSGCRKRGKGKGNAITAPSLPLSISSLGRFFLAVQTKQADSE